MGQPANLVHALIRDDRGVAVAEYGMIVTVIGGLIVGLMALGVNLNDCVHSVGSLLTSVTGRYY